MTLDIDDVRKETVERDENGELVPNKEEIEWCGEMKEVEIYPITGGILNKIATYEEGLRVLEPEAVANVIDVAYANLDGIDEDVVKDLPYKQLNELVSPIETQMPGFEVEESEGN